VKTLTSVIAVTVALMLVPTAAQAQLPVGEADGVRVVREQGGIVAIFTPDAAKLYKRIAGKKVLVSCSRILEEATQTNENALVAPRGRGKLVTGDRSRGYDYCRLWLAPRKITIRGKSQRVPRQLIVSVPLTQQGAVFLDEEMKTFAMLGVAVVAGIVEEREKLPGHPTYDQLVGKYPKIARRVVGLAAPGDTPPAGKIGYYSDGAQHIALVVLSASGRRLFIEEAADDVLSTNVADYLFGESS
jgi:hypothetical protein